MSQSMSVGQVIQMYHDELLELGLQSKSPTGRRMWCRTAIPRLRQLIEKHAVKKRNGSAKFSTEYLGSCLVKYIDGHTKSRPTTNSSDMVTLSYSELKSLKSMWSRGVMLSKL